MTLTHLCFLQRKSRGSGSSTTQCSTWLKQALQSKWLQINSAITEEELPLNNQIGSVLNGFCLCGSRWEFSRKQWETVCNIFLLIGFMLLPKARCRPLSGEMELGEEKLTADAEELDGSDDCVEEQPVWGWESGGGTDDGWSCLWTPVVCVLLPRWIIVKLSVCPGKTLLFWLHDQTENTLECKCVSEQLLFFFFFFNKDFIVWVKCYETQMENTTYLSLYEYFNPHRIHFSN